MHPPTPPGEATWKAPGPGQWSFDASHQQRPFGRLFESVYLTPYAEGFARAMEGAGSPLRTIEILPVNGWLYMSPRPLGGPESATAPPPAFVMRTLFRLVPSLRARAKQARRYVEARVFAARAESWFGEELAQWSARLDALAVARSSELSDAELATQLEGCASLSEALVGEHFAHAVDSGFPIGDFFNACAEMAGASPAEAMRSLAGFCDPTRAPLEDLDRICDAVLEEATPELRARWVEGEAAPEAPELEALMQLGPATAKALERYWLAHGDAPCAGMTVFDATLREMPELLARNLHARLRARQGVEASDPSTRARVEAEAAAAQLRRRITSDQHPRFDQLLADARAASRRRESDANLLCRCIGLLRRVALEVGRRSVARKTLHEVESVLDLDRDQLLALARGQGPAPEAIAAYTATRRWQETLTPPASLGPQVTPPGPGHFPPAVARLTSGIFAFVDRFAAEADPIEAEGLAGHGVSPGVVEGRACVCHGPEDFADFRAGDILVARLTSPSYNVLLAMAGGVVTETGGLICHAAIVAREFGIPGIVGCADACAQIPSGARVRVDGDRGTVEILDAAPARPVPVSTSASAYEGRVPRAHASSAPACPLVEALDATRFGGKSSTLARAKRAGITTPEGWALDADACETVAAGDRAPLEVLRERLADPSTSWAVRSSALGEDGSAHSFAGQHLTRLGVCGFEDVCRAIEEVWRSAHAPGALAYRRRLGIEGEPRMAVLLQPTLEVEVAGVGFAAERRAQPCRLFEAAWGLGESVVAGELTPDRYITDLEGREIERELGNKTSSLTLVDGKLRRIALSSARADAPCLDAAQLRRLSELARACETCFEGPQDIEWAFVDDTLICLQSRPVTRRLELDTSSRRRRPA